ncbi:hypothetical protein [Rhodopseudomonas telluris]|uniref:Uncharacterized protein n=1 Tax=Rhodopseudomonas telluris TaxID=644215 RepID=A0ABV6EZN2_9BRAD
MTKQEQFLFLVQTAVLANGINLAASDDTREKYRHVYSAPGVMGLMLDAIEASEKIPETMTAHTAAVEFNTYMLDNLRHQEEHASSRFAAIPRWFAK